MGDVGTMGDGRFKGRGYPMKISSYHFHRSGQSAMHMALPMCVNSLHARTNHNHFKIKGSWETGDQGKRIPNGDKVPITLCTGILRILIQHILCILHEAATTGRVQSAMHVHCVLTVCMLELITHHSSST